MTKITNNAEFTRSYGPTALVTGASSGIGQAFATLLASMGIDLILVARRIERLENLAETLRDNYAVEVTTAQIDLSEPDAAEQIIQACADQVIGLIVSNAGFGFKGEYDQGDATEMTDIMMVNCHTPMQLIHRLLPAMRQRGRGGIVLTSSVEGLIGCPYSAAYSASKGFLANLGESLWGELSPEGIDVLTLCPGATDTEAPAKQGIDPASLEHLASPDEVAHLALENLGNGPIYIPSDHYRSVFEYLLSMPRGDALKAMAANMKPAALQNKTT